jgi:predicted secreted protein
MSGMKGRSVQIKRAGVVIAGVRTKSIKIGGSPIDVTNDDDDGIRKLLDQPGQVDVSISCSGIVVNETLRNEALGTTDRVQATQFIYQGFDNSPTNTHGWSGEFFLASYSETGEYQGVVTFEAEFQSAGPVTYQPK